MIQRYGVLIAILSVVIASCNSIPNGNNLIRLEQPTERERALELSNSHVLWSGLYDIEIDDDSVLLLRVYSVEESQFRTPQIVMRPVLGGTSSSFIVRFTQSESGEILFQFASLSSTGLVRGTPTVLGPLPKHMRCSAAYPLNEKQLDVGVETALQCLILTGDDPQEHIRVATQPSILALADHIQRGYIMTVELRDKDTTITPLL